MKFIHLTDTHMMGKGLSNWGLDPEWRLRQAIKSVRSDHNDASFCVVTGDLTHLGNEYAYESFFEIIRDIDMPIHLVLGNHDNREGLSKHLPKFCFDEFGFVQYKFQIGDAYGIVVDTVRERSHSGEFCYLRAKTLEKLLNECEDEKIYLFMHHPPTKIGIPSMDRYALIEEEYFWSTLDPYKNNIQHIFFGHIHRPICGQTRGVSFSTVRGTNHQVALDMSDSKLIVGSHEPPQYGIVLVNENSVIVHIHDYLDRSDRFLMDGASELSRKYPSDPASLI